jgi:hypothetical protein
LRHIVGTDLYVRRQQCSDTKRKLKSSVMPSSAFFVS